MIKFLRKIFLYSAILFVVLNVIAILVDYRLRNSDIFKLNAALRLDTLSENLIIGSSRALTGVDSELLGKLTKKSWFNIAIDDTPITTHLTLYKILVKNKSTPKVLLLQYDSGDEQIREELHDKDYQLMIFSFSRLNGLLQYFSSKKHGLFYYYIPFLKYTTFNTELVFGFIRVVINQNYRHRFNKIGDFTYPAGFAFRSECGEKPIREINFNNSAFLELKSLCHENGTQLITFTAPYRCQSIKTNSKPENYLNLSGVFKNDSMFYDEQHLNPYGRELFTKVLADEIEGQMY